MRVTRVSLVPSLLTICLCAAVWAPQQADSIESMKLLTSDVGWAANRSSLFWTTDNGKHWKDIAPRTRVQGEIVSVFFLDNSVGWVLLLAGGQQADEPRFDLAATIDAGAHWSTTPVVIPNLNSESMQFMGDGRIDFVDPRHGWLNLSVASSANFRLGALLATTDGGKQWDWVPQSPGVSGAIRFPTLKDGWLAGGPGGEKLFATHDGSKTWQEVSLPPPAQAQRTMRPTYDLPTFEDGKRGFLPVTYGGGEGAGLSLVLFSSDDGGLSWKLDRTLPNLPEIYGGVPLPSVVVESILITSLVTNQTNLTLKTVERGGKFGSVTAAVAEHVSSVDQLSFVLRTRGWILLDGKLLSTADGGSSWSNITPRATRAATADGVDHQLESSTDFEGCLSLAPSAAVSPGVHLGFHACQAPSAANLQTW